MQKAHRLLTAVAACWFLMAGQPAKAEKIVTGASSLTQQHPFYVLLADAMKKGAEQEGVSLQPSIANQDLNQQISDAVCPDALNKQRRA